MRITSAVDLSGLNASVSTLGGASGGDYDSRQLLTSSGSVTVHKGWLYINASGGGGGGASGSSAGTTTGGSGGGSGLSCLGAKIWIPDTRTINVTIGAAGGAQTTAGTAGNNGGSTTIANLPITLPSNIHDTWTLYGGGGGTSLSFGKGAVIPLPFNATANYTKFNTYAALPANKGNYAPAAAYDYSYWGGGSRGGSWFSSVGTAGGTSAESSAFIWILPHPLWHDVFAYMGAYAGGYTGYGGMGGHSLFGKGGNGSTYTTQANESEAGTGYGAGGGGGRGGVTGAINHGKAGAPGFFECWQ